MNPRDVFNCLTCAKLVGSEAGAFVCTAVGPELTRWRIEHKPIGELPPMKTPRCPGWTEKE